MHKPEEFYNKLAYLFFSVAGVDGKVDKMELEHLHNEIQLIWKETDTDSHDFGTSGGIEIEAVFEWLEEEGYDSNDAFQEFKIYAIANSNQFDAKTKNNIVHTCNEIADRYHKINKKEKELIGEVKKFLNSLGQK
ncbi:MAG: hypothetical protein HOP11_00840 [Saprospiraceae bacterium]|nr:hypothetical protein [Saprospiraceae bacterium]